VFNGQTLPAPFGRFPSLTFDQLSVLGSDFFGDRFIFFIFLGRKWEH
jgi:hypothetical protein